MSSHSYASHYTTHALKQPQKAPPRPMHLQGILVQNSKHFPRELARTLRDIVFAAIERLRVHHLEKVDAPTTNMHGTTVGLILLHESFDVLVDRAVRLKNKKQALG